jgi:hypothetical protein
MFRKILTVTVIAVLTGIAAPAFAQSDVIELLRSDLATQKKALLTGAMDMTEQESEIFWPIYNEYSVELRKVGDERIAMIKEYADNYDSMTDEMAKDLTKRALSTQEERIKLYKKYNGKMAKELSPRLAARWLQAEHAINTMIDVQIASELPLMK